MGDRPGIGDRPGGGNWWDDNRPNRPGRGDINIDIDNNFQKNINWSTNRNHWGYNPWWNRPAHYPWYGGSWRCGWVRPPIYYPPRWPGYYPGYSPGTAIAWGLLGWGLGNLIFDCGYSHYHNPYPPAPIVIESGPTITYEQPITVVASETVPATEEETTVKATQAELAMNDSLAKFKSGDYLEALEGVNQAIAASPGDGAFHEYRALILFALGQFGEAAGVLNPLLASSPGWDWSTMIQLYGNPEDYTDQLRKLEDYAEANPESAPSQFLLGYHYMVGTHLEDAAESFAKAAELVPADRVAAQMAELAASSTTSAEGASTDPADIAEAPEAPTEVPLEQILGSWSSDNGENGTVTLSLGEEGGFVWKFEMEGEEPFEMKGEYNLGQANMLTLDGEDSQMAGTVTLDAEGGMNFVLAGGPPGDPGLSFSKG